MNMIATSLNMANQRAQVALALRAMTPAERLQSVLSLVYDTGGSLVRPDGHGGWGSVRCEIELLGLAESGDDVHDAIDRWMQTAIAGTGS